VNVFKVGHGPNIRQNEFDCAYVSAVFRFIPLVFYNPYIKPGGHGSIRLLQAPFFFLLPAQLNLQPTPPIHIFFIVILRLLSWLDIK